MGKEANAFGAILLLKIFEFRGEEVECLIPGSAAESSCTSFSRANQRVFQTVGVIEQLRACIAASAKLAFCKWMMRVSLHLQNFSIRDLR